METIKKSKQCNKKDGVPKGTNQIACEEVEKLTTHKVTRPCTSTSSFRGSAMETSGTCQQPQPLGKVSGKHTPLTKTQKRNQRRRNRLKRIRQSGAANTRKKEGDKCGEKRSHWAMSTLSTGATMGTKVTRIWQSEAANTRKEGDECGEKRSHCTLSTLSTGATMGAKVTRIWQSEAANTRKEEGDECGEKRSHCTLSTPSTGATMEAKVTNMAVVKDGFPSCKLNSAEAMTIQKEILRKVDTLSGEQLPVISFSTVTNGILILQCDDTWTVGWLKKEFHNNRNVLKGLTLKVVLAKELFKPVKVAFKTKDLVTKEPKTLLNRIFKFNPKLKSKNWRVLHRLIEPQSIRWIFEVDMETAKEIMAAGCLAYTGLDRGFFKILKGPYNQFSRTEPRKLQKTFLKKTEVKPQIAVEPEAMSSTSWETCFHQVPAMLPVNEVSHAFPTTPSNPPENLPRTTAISPSRHSLLGDQPPTVALSPAIPPTASHFPERANLRIIGDQDLRSPPFIDSDMRPLPPPIMATGGRDMRHPRLVDQDLRPLNAPPGLPENRPFNDPRYQNVAGPDMRPIRGSQFDRPQLGLPADVRPGFDNRGVVGMSPRINDPRSTVIPPIPNVPPGHAAPPNVRMALANSELLHGGISPNAASSSRPGNNPLLAAATAIVPHDQEKASLIMQVLQLTEQQIALLPSEQRQSIMILKEQIARSQQTH